MTLGAAPAAAEALRKGRSPMRDSRAGRVVRSVPMALAAFGLYRLSALILQARGEVNLFGADWVLYRQLAGGNVVERLGSDYAVDRITRFHPLTTGMAVAWMSILRPLTHWIAPRC